MVKSSISSYSYLCDCKTSFERHHILPPSTNTLTLTLNHFLRLLLLLPFIAFFFFNVSLNSPIFIVLWSLLLLLKLLLGNPIRKESVVLMPAFGVQLETHYASGRVSRQFIPVDKILKPVLLECVTPLTCYWNLSLIVRGEAQLISVFKVLRPPAKMLVPIWKALCAGTIDDDKEESSSKETAEDEATFNH
ncbi:uncharacterized protein LOC133812948 [Humulus lupulus]|uniref:uncharacterized protein LOC133812948 n=1 Tax=Humulus lupulus TaxID=3486 RepID=UPI002B402A3E|nr:uncharacterized protein LOC133812948 [Humulus lupulus]XP_062102788.1 uncharacterized protein LOC133812948 [Humulus lupulus]